jgi:hypothetical protein
MLKQAQIPQLYTRAALQPATYKADDRTVEMTWSAGARTLRVSAFEGPITEELSMDPMHIRMDRLQSGAPLLKDHDMTSIESVIGVVERAWIANGEGRAVVRFADDPAVEPILAKVQSGILRNISVGYRVHKYEIQEPKSRGELPLFRAVDWEPMELSIVPVPADPSAQIRSQDSLHSVILTTRGNAMSDPENQVPAEEAQAPEVKDVETRAETPEPVKVIDAGEIATRAVQAERERVFAIRDAVRLAKLDDSIADEMIRAGKSFDQCRDDIWRRWADRVDETATQPNHNEPATNKRSAEIAATLLKQVSGVK